MKRLRIAIKSISLFALLLGASSCATHLPEFQDATSLKIGEHKVAAGAYAGGGGTSNVGGGVMHSVGIHDRIDWTTQAHLGYSGVVSDNKLTYSALTGPKFSSSNERFALSIPAGVSTNPDDGVELPMVLIMPTAYWTFNPQSSSKNTLFIRTEGVIITSDQARMHSTAWATIGFRKSWETEVATYGVNLNLTYAAAYLGFTVDL